MSNNISFASPDITDDEIKAVNDAIRSGYLTNGEIVREFESRIASFSRVDHVVAVDSCTAAMELTLRALGIGPGDQVITTPYTYTATADVIRNVGAEIVFVDLDGNSFEMDYGKLVDAFSWKTKAIIPVDFGGKICNYKAIRDAISQHEMYVPNNKIQEAIGRIVVIADAAHSFGAYNEYGVSGTQADFTCFSFHAIKPVTTGGEGGAVVWRNCFPIDNNELERTIRLFADHGQTTRNKDSGWEYDIELFGQNHIMTNLDAAFGIVQMDRFDETTEKRLSVARRYDSAFKENGITPLVNHVGEGCRTGLHLYPISVPGGEEERNKVYHSLKEKGIQCNVHYKPLPMFTAYKNEGFDIADYPNAYKMFAQVLTLPFHSSLDSFAVARIISRVSEVMK